MRPLYFGIDAIESAAKKSMVAIILRGPPWSAEEQAEIVAIAKVTFCCWSACCWQCCRASICRARCCVAGS